MLAHDHEEWNMCQRSENRNAEMVFWRICIWGIVDQLIKWIRPGEKLLWNHPVTPPPLVTKVGDR